MLKKIFLALSPCLISLVVFGQNGNQLNIADRPSSPAQSIETTPIIDGDVINDAAWQSLPTIGQLIQTKPQAGEPSSEKTDIRVAFDQSTFYLSVVCYDANPDQLVVSDARRDASLEDTDAFMFILDTYHDGQNGFMFGTNSIGVEYDAQVDNEGQGNFNSNRQQGGMIGGFNLNWDASWQVKTEVGDYGWSAEFAIPFKTLRYKAGENVTWGVNFQRIIRKTNEIAYWAPLPIQFDLKRLSLAGDLTALDLQNPGNLKVIPYALGQVVNDQTVDPAETSLDGAFGADIKYSITPSVTLDLTYNTDFAQVEVDEQQVNLDRFNLFFPEKRAFFLENAGLFSVGSPGEIDLFFSRKIGIGDDGQLVPIIGGARVSGKINNTSIGALSMFTEEVSSENIEANNFSVARINHQIGGRSSIGGAFVSRTGMGDIPDDYNRVYAIDGRWGIGKKAQISGFYASSETPNIDGRNHAFKTEAKYEWNGLRATVAFTEVAENFNPEVGFLLRQAFRKPEFLLFKQVRMSAFGLLEIRPHVSYRSYWNFEGFQETSFLHIDNHWAWKQGFEIHTGINITSEGVTNDFNIFKKVYTDRTDSVVVNSGTYNHSEAQIVISTNASKPVYVSTRHVIGGFFGGNRISNSGTLGLRVGDKFKTELKLSHNNISLPNGDFTTTVLGGRISYSFTPRMFTQSLIQYNSVTESISANIRFGLIKQANTGLFLVYNENWDDGNVVNRSFTLKYSRLFDLL